MTKALALDADRGAALVIGPGEGESHWQPVPANGFIDVLIAPHLVEMQNRFSMGTQTVPPGGTAAAESSSPARTAAASGSDAPPPRPTETGSVLRPLTVLMPRCPAT